MAALVESLPDGPAIEKDLRSADPEVLLAAEYAPHRERAAAEVKTHCDVSLMPQNRADREVESVRSVTIAAGLAFKQSRGAVKLLGSELPSHVFTMAATAWKAPRAKIAN
jgi:hypothetical protein